MQKLFSTSLHVDNFLAYNSPSLHYLDFLRKQLVDKLERELEAIIQHGVRSEVLHRTIFTSQITSITQCAHYWGKVSPCIRVIEIEASLKH